MRSIFSKILLWAIGTTVVSLVGFQATTRILWKRLPGPADHIARFHDFIFDDAKAAYTLSGREGLKRYLSRLDARFEVKHYLVDASGTDLIEGVDRSELLAHAAVAPEPPREYRGKLFVASAPAESYRLLIQIEPKISPAGFLPYYLWIFLLIAALGYALAVYMARPLQRLRYAVDRFGQGDLDARTHSTRRDEIGDLSRAFDRMAERTETLMTAQQRLLQDVSHELRSPLSRLRLAVHLASSSMDRDLAIERIKKEVDLLAALVDELLQVSAAEEDPRARTTKPCRWTTCFWSWLKTRPWRPRPRVANWSSPSDPIWSPREIANCFAEPSTTCSATPSVMHPIDPWSRSILPARTTRQS